jgi:hypothetical protein
MFSAARVAPRHLLGFLVGYLALLMVRSKGIFLALDRGSKVKVIREK